MQKRRQWWLRRRRQLSGQVQQPTARRIGAQMQLRAIGQNGRFQPVAFLIYDRQ